MTSTIPPTKKTVYLIRHAESLENERIQSVKRTLSTLGKFRIPSSQDVSTSMELMNIRAQVDTDVSVKGREQILQISQLIQNQQQNEENSKNFINDIELIVHSPLKRARDTCQGILGCCANTSNNEATTAATTTTILNDNNNDDDDDDDNNNNNGCRPRLRRVLELDSLTEKSPEEWIPGKTQSFKNRIQQFEQWLSEQPENVVAIVGHSQYFKAMLRLSYKFGNCDVWQVEFVANENGLEEEKKDDADDTSKNHITTDNERQQQDRERTKKRLSILKKMNTNSKRKSLHKETTTNDDDHKNDNNAHDLPHCDKWRSLKRLYSIHDDNEDNNTDHHEVK